MSEDNETTEETNLDGVLDENIRRQVREGEKARKELATLKTQMDAQAKDLAMTKAGVPEEGPGKYFRTGYDGELNVEAIRAAATQDGILQTAPAANQADEAELQQLRQMQATGAGEPPSPQSEAAFWETVKAKGAELPWAGDPQGAGRAFIDLLRDAPPSMGIQWGLEQ